MTLTLEQAYSNFYTNIKNHICEKSPDLKAVSASDSGIYIADRLGKTKLKGTYITIETDSDSNDAWVNLLSTPNEAFEIVRSIRGLGWQSIVVWFPQWNHSQIVDYFSSCPKCLWRGANVTFASLPEEEFTTLNRLGREFFRDRDYIYFVDHEDVINKEYGDSLRVLEFCLSQGILPERIIYTGKTKSRDCLLHWIYRVQSLGREEFEVVAWRRDPVNYL